MEKLKDTLSTIPWLILAMAIMGCGMARAMTLDIDQCRQLAISSNKSLKAASQQQMAAYYERKEAFTKYFPRVNGVGAYMRTGDELAIVSAEQKGMLNALVPGVGDELRTDTRNLGTLGATLTQPIYMGGKIRAYNRITHYAERVAQARYDLTLQNLVVEVDETFWTIANLQEKKKLIDSNISMLKQLQANVDALVEAGMSTKADQLSVAVKLNEAEIAQIQIDNGIDMARLLMCQLCGLDMDTDITLTLTSIEDLPMAMDAPTLVSQAWSQRDELKMLNLGSKVAQEKVKVARAEFLPSVALTAGYLSTYPSLFDGFEKKLKGTWGVGVAVSVPIVTSGERFYKVKAQKAEAIAAEFEEEEAKEKVELQVNQSVKRLRETRERVIAAQTAVAEADENVRTASIGVQEGVIPVINGIQAQTAWISAHSQLVEAQIDLRLALLYLDQSIGAVNVK
ncbi:MAG: TolC family protein [Bacteroidales bacterium]|nr:TolC family protein [Bacteroidales bacterium]